MRILIIILTIGIISCGKGGTNTALPGTTPIPIDDQAVASTTLCMKVDAGSGVTAGYNYQIVNYASGDQMVICSVSLAAGQYSETYVYKGGSTTSMCYVTADLDAPTSGYWTFSNVTGTKKTLYTDVGSAHNNYQYNFAAGECVTN